jgi:hypothetical protein
MNRRTNKFEDYLTSNNIDSLDDFVGCHERLTFQNVEAYNGKTYINIVEREFIG